MLKLRGLEADAVYTLTASEGGEATCTGKELMEGFAIVLPKHTGNIWFYERVG